MKTGKCQNIVVVAVFSNTSGRDNKVVWTFLISHKDMQPVRVELLVEGNSIRKYGKGKRVVLGKFHWKKVNAYSLGFAVGRVFFILNCKKECCSFYTRDSIQ